MAASDDRHPRAAADKRDSERVAILGDLTGEVMIFQPMAVREISRGGAQVETAFPLQLNSLHDVRLTLADHSIVVKARVAHCRISDLEQEQVVYRSGLEFVGVSERTAAAIGDFLRTLRDAHSG